MLKKLVVNTGVQILGKGISLVVSLLTTGLLTRKLGTEIYGEFILITAMSTFFDTLADFGTSIIGVREASKKETEAERIKVWSNMALLRLILAGFSLGLGLILIYSWPDFETIRTEAVLAWSMMILTSLAGSLAIVWQTRIKMELKVVVEVLFPTVFLVCLWIYKGEISLIWVFGTYLLARMVTLAMGWQMIGGVIDFRKCDWEKMRHYLKLSWPMGLYLMIFGAYDRAIDSMMIRRFLGVNEVAWYGLAYKIYAVLQQPAYYLVSGIFPILSGKNNNKKSLFYGSAIALTVGAASLLLGVWIFAPLMIQILAGDGFEAAVPVLRILSIALIFSYLGHLVGFTLISRDGQKEMLRTGIVVLSFNLIANLVIIPRYGIGGAAIVTVITEAISLLLMGWKLKKRG